MLIKYDDLPLQQTVDSLAYLNTSDRDAYGRYWFNGFAPDGEYYFGIAFAVYPNRDVMDCAVSIVRKDGTQDSFRASRRCPIDRTDMQVGPFKMEITELMRVIHITIADNDTGFTADLTFTGTTPVHEEPHDRVRPRVRMTMQMKRYTQFGRWSGFIDVKGRRQEIDSCYGIRDRSWGWRMCGEPVGGTHDMVPSQAFYLWGPIIWDDMCTHYGTWENEHGVSMKDFGQIFPLYKVSDSFDTLDPSGFREIGIGGHDLRFDSPDHRFVTGGTFELKEEDGHVLSVEVEPLLRFHMYGIGYNHPEWGHGVWKGEEAFTSEHWNVHNLDLTHLPYQHVQQVIRARMGDKIGYGVLEQMVIGPHQQYGFVGYTDPLTKTRDR